MCLSYPFKLMDKSDTREYLQSDEGLAELTKLAEDGATVEEIARHFGVHRATLYRWSKASQDIHIALSTGKKVADERVEESLYEQCFDRHVKEETIEYDDQGHVIKRTVKARVLPASVNAIQYWLSNRMNDVWKARQQLELTGSKDAPVIFVNDMPKGMKSESTEGSLVIFATEPEPDTNTESE